MSAMLVVLVLGKDVEMSQRWGKVILYVILSVFVHKGIILSDAAGYVREPC